MSSTITQQECRNRSLDFPRVDALIKKGLTINQDAGIVYYSDIHEKLLVKSLVTAVTVGGSWCRDAKKNVGIAVLSFNASVYDPENIEDVYNYSQVIASLIPLLKYLDH
jgi:hypothetical protein